MNFNNIKPYLPSKKFQKSLLVFVVLVGVIFIIFFISSNQKEKYASRKGLAINNKTIEDVVAIDTDGDGVYDWEEALWGTDKNKDFTFEGTSDSTYIENKRKTLNLNTEVNTKELTETDLFAREFFKVYLALNSQGVDKEAINNFSNALGQKIINPVIENFYSDRNIKFADIDNNESKINYYLKIQKLFNDYRTDYGLGNELSILSTSVSEYENNNNENQTKRQNELLLVGQAYQEFATKVINTPVPESLSTYHLQIANNSHNVGTSILNAAQVVKDPIVGLSALSSYEKYTQDLVDSVAELEKIIEEISEEIL